MTISPPIRPDFVTVRFPTARTPVVSVSTNPFDAAVPANSLVISASIEQTIGVAALSKGGPLDLVGIRGSNIVYSAYNPTSESFGAVQIAQSKNTPTNFSRATIYLGDINGDGLPDLLSEGTDGAYVGLNTPSTVANSVLFSWTRVILPPGAAA